MHDLTAIRRLFTWPSLLLLVAFAAMADENQWFIRLDDQPPPKAPSKTINSAETVDEYPGPPVVPMRQSERKKPPQPDYLLAKVIWGESASFTGSTGKKLPIDDWNLVSSDAERLIGEGKNVGLSYHWANANLNEFSFDPKRMPSLLFSGVRSLKLSPSQISALREYVLRGGMLVFDSVYGSPYFYESAKQVCQQMFPENRVRTLPLDHPLFHVFHTIDQVRYPEDPARTRPVMEGVYIGSRVGILVSEYGLGTGWEGDQRVFAKLKANGLKPKYYDVDSARRIGANIAGYIVGYADAGVIEGTPEMFGIPDQKSPTDEFVFAQIRHDGAWNVHPGAATTLLKRLRRQSAIRVNLKRVAVDPERDDMSAFPFLYMTGLDAFSFSDKGSSALRKFVNDGGKLLINNGLGLATFHQSVKRELGKLFPDAKFERLPADHDLYNCLASIKEVQYTPTLATSHPELAGEPVLFGMSVNGELRIIYSPYDIEAGWLNTYFPLLRGYENESAQQLGMNLMAYAVTH